MGRLHVEPHNLTGKIIIVTGANSGIGLETARYFAANHAKVILACRNSEKAQVAVDDIKATTGATEVEAWTLDLGSFASVRAFADKYLATGWPLDILVNNAGLGGTPQKVITKDCFEELYQVNHLSHFLLTNLLLPALKKNPGSRVVNVSSALHFYGTLDFDNLNFEKKSYSWGSSYNNSKLYNVLFTIELAKRLKEDGIIVHAAHPGFVQTALGKEYGALTKALVRIAQSLFGRDAVEGAQTTIYAAVSKEAGETTGQYWASLKVQTPNKIALVPENQERFWKVSAEAVKMQMK